MWLGAGDRGAQSANSIPARKIHGGMIRKLWRMNQIFHAVLCDSRRRDERERERGGGAEIYLFQFQFIAHRCGIFALSGSARTHKGGRIRKMYCLLHGIL